MLSESDLCCPIVGHKLSKIAKQGLRVGTEGA